MVDWGSKAKVILSPGLKKWRGKLGTLIYRQLYGETVAGAVPDFSGHKLSAQQKAHLRKMGTAVKHAKILLKVSGVQSG
jgi:hypothetical protein